MIFAIVSRSIRMTTCRVSTRNLVFGSRLAYRQTVPISRRFYATEGPEVDEGKQRVDDLVQKLQSNPEVAEQISRLGQVMVSKDLLPKPEDMIDSNGQVKKLTLMQQMKIFMDKDVRNAVSDLGKVMAKSGIKMTKEDFEIIAKYVQKSAGTAEAKAKIQNKNNDNESKQ